MENFNKKYERNYDVRKIVYCLIIFFLIVTFFFGPTTLDIEKVLNENSIKNTNTNNQIPTLENPPPLIPSQNTNSNTNTNNQNIITNDKKADSKEESDEKINEKNKNNNDEGNQEKINNDNNNSENENNKGKRKVKGFWKKLFLMTGFLGIIYYLVWKESNDPGHYGDNDDDGDNKNEKDKKNKKKENDGYLLLNNNEDLDI